MVFSSIPFLYYFLPCVLLFYYSAPGRLKNAVLLLASIIFYGWGEPKFVFVMLLTILQGYLFGILIEKSGGRRAGVYAAVSAVISFGVLGYCKYADFFIENFNRMTGLSVPLLRVTLPVGISFYTFQIVSYIADVYRRKVPAQRNFVNLAVYIAMFPQLIAGPIVRYADISRQLNGRRHSLEKCALGIRRFILGLGKKVLIANALGELCSIFRASEEKSVLFFWVYAAACALQIYFDFSGYSDMAIGLGRILGFDFPENFNYPFISGSATEFWRRWHISLGSWFRDYVYIPLGGNRVKRPRWLFNLMLVWFLTGFWHGAAWNFILWGLFFGALLILEKLALGKILEKAGFLRYIYMVPVILVSFVLFDAADLSRAWDSVRAMFGAGGFPAVSRESLYYLKSYGGILILAVIGATPLLSMGVSRLRKRAGTARALNAVEPVALLLLLLVITGYIVDGSFNPFLYFRF
ncbi:MAG: MBOAT family protein [Butyrivibrio sp.]|nr:MBOAT family protein [Acetatifactor muris]MCM1561357.1 MBOAT family protein [Butyrivibrio sp.]